MLIEATSGGERAKEWQEEGVIDSTRLDSVENLHRRCRFERPKIKIDGCDYGIKDESKSSRITSVGSLLWRKGTWNVIARPRNLCAGPNLHSQIVNSALTLTLSLRIFDSKLWLHVSSERREKEFGRGREKSGREGKGRGRRLRVSGAENSVTTDNWKRTTDAYANDPRKWPFLFLFAKFSKH